MKHQDLTSDLIRIYFDFYDGRFFINSPSCIYSAEQNVQTGTTYLFSPMPDESGIKLMLVKLLNVWFDGGIVYLQLMDILKGRIFQESQVVKPYGEDCTWMLNDMDYFLQKLNKKKIVTIKEMTICVNLSFEIEYFSNGI
jgi:hypothetical protein